MLKPSSNQSLKCHLIGVVLLVCLLGCKQAWAESFNFDQQKYRISGFATIGATRSGNNALGFRRYISQDGQSNGQWSLEPDTSLGVQLNVDFYENFSGAMQVVVRDRTSNDLDDAIEWAYLSYRVSPFIIRAGRLGPDVFLLSEYRNLGFAYLWARPPMEFYGSLSFDFVDGLDATYKNNLGDGSLEVKLFAGEMKNTLSFQGDTVDFIVSPIYGLAVTWENTNWHIKLAFTHDNLDKRMNDEFGAKLLIDALNQTLAGIEGTPIVWPEAAQLVEELDMTGKNIRYYSFGVAYDANSWIIQGEAAYITSDYEMYQDYYNSYLSVGYRIGPTTLYTMAAFSENREKRKLISQPILVIPDSINSLPQPQKDAIITALNGQLAALSPLQGGLQQYFDSAIIEQKTFSLGIRWNIQHNLAFKAQYDRTQVGAYSHALWDARTVQVKDHTLNTYSLNLSYMF